MCGIFGMVIPNGNKIEKTLLQKATDLLFHRGPDSGGYFIKNNVGLGNRRLAIVDLSDKGHQPFHYKGLTITYNGELYNYLELRNSLSKIGHVFKTNTDTEVVLAAYSQWGTECVQRFNGMWSFAIFDHQKKQLFCSKDRFGIKPFYYIWQNHTFVFASEIKAFRALPFWKPIVNQKRASDYLIKGLQNHTDETLFKHVKQLLPGHQLVFDLSSYTYNVEKYYDIAAIEKNTKVTFDNAAFKIRELLKKAILVHSRSDVKVGSALSGGLDSSSIVALQCQMLGKENDNLEVVSYSAENPQFDESSFVQYLIKKYPVKVHWTKASFEETFAIIDEVIKAHDEPLLSASLIAQFLVFRTANENGIKVMLDGQGADELLAGYGTYYLPYLKQIGLKRPFWLLKEIAGLLSKHQIKTSKKLSFIKVKPDYQQYLKCSNGEPEKLTKNFRDYSNYMIKRGILPALLHFEDRNSMAHGVESRVPFLDYRLVEFCMGLPPEYKIRKGVRKAILREAMKKDLPEKIIKRYDKMGFTTPQEHWMNENPEIFLQSIKTSAINYPEIFNNSLIRFAEQAFMKKQSEHYSFLWRVMTFGRWLEIMNIKLQ